MTETWIQTILMTGASLIFLVIAFVPMERVFPARKGQKFFRPGWLLDFCFFLGQYLCWGGLVLYVLFVFNDYLLEIIPLNVQLAVRSQPMWLQVIEVFLIGDLLIYWGHRLQHRVDFLWRFHKVHHTTEHLDWLAAHREHPLDSIYTIGLINLPVFILGFPIEDVAVVIAFRGIWAIYIHSNVRLNIGPIRMLIGSPDLHHWHHYLDRDAGNYANISPLMDILFGTYTYPDHEPEAYGIREEFPKNYLGQLIAPILPSKTWKKLEPYMTFRRVNNSAPEKP